MENKGIKEAFNVVIQPDYAKTVLLAFQKKYGISTVDFLRYYKDGFELPISEKDIEKWLFQYNLFVIAEGDIGELINEYGFGTVDSQSPPSSEVIYDCFFREQLAINGQANNKNGEAISASPFLLLAYKDSLLISRYSC